MARQELTDAIERARADPQGRFVVRKGDWSGGGGAFFHHPRRYNYARELDGRQRGRVIPSAAGFTAGRTVTDSTFAAAFVSFRELGTNWYGLNGRYVYRLDNWGTPGASYWTEVYDAGAGAVGTALLTFAIGSTVYLLAAFGDTAAYAYSSTGAAWTASTRGGNDKYAKFWGVLNGILHKTRAPNLWYQSTNPLNGGTAWSTEDQVGEATGAITSVKMADGLILFAKEENVFYLDQFGLMQEFVPSFHAHRDPANGAGSAAWNQKLFYPTFDGDLFRISRAGVLAVSPFYQTVGARMVDSAVTPALRPRSCTDTTRYLYASVKRASGTDADEIFALEETENGYIWHFLVSALGASLTADALAISSAATSGPVLWAAMDTNGGFRTRYWILPNGPDPTLDSRCRFATGGILWEPWLDLGAPGLWERFTVWTEGNAADSIRARLISENGDALVDKTLNAGESWELYPSQSQHPRRVRPRFDWIVAANTRHPALASWELSGRIVTPDRPTFAPEGVRIA